VTMRSGQKRKNVQNEEYLWWNGLVSSLCWLIYELQVWQNSTEINPQTYIQISTNETGKSELRWVYCINIKILVMMLYSNFQNITIMVLILLEYSSMPCNRMLFSHRENWILSLVTTWNWNTREMK
jgi:hypothetical protein